MTRIPHHVYFIQIMILLRKKKLTDKKSSKKHLHKGRLLKSLDYNLQVNYHMQNKGEHNISIVGDEFILDGHPLQIISGSLHYFRLPAAYWRDRLRKLKAAGLNSVSTYEFFF